MKVDLHVHSTYSDGAYTPRQVIDTAVSVGLNAISITDHDNILAYEISKSYIREKGYDLEIIPGVEINTLYNGEEIHILGYFMDFENKNFQKMIKIQQQARVKQTQRIVELLNKKANIPVTMNQISNYVAPGGSIGRPHIAKAIVVAGGAQNVIEAYAKYINDNSPVYIRRETVTPHEAVEIIYEAGGIPIVAHPCDIDKPKELVEDLMNYGLRGLEAYHRKHTPAMVEYYSSMAENYGLIVTGGSDFHSPNNNNVIYLGKIFIPDWVYNNLKEEKRNIEIAGI
ncbi:MAG: PHP domain-containing protein [Candidatus Gastranaerophilales bacterium]|nr:PHP domain-containing protein [Candidatus Gastranaerophilales bacterium]